MAFVDALNKHNEVTVPRGNRVSVLLDRLAKDNTEDHAALLLALTDPNIRNITITRALREEYGHDVVKYNSVAEYRSKFAPVNGL